MTPSSSVPETSSHTRYWASCLILVGAAMRMASIDAPLTSDELASASIWAQMPFDKIPSNYQFPNNHIFHTLLISLILKTFGANPVWLRLPVLVCSIISLFIIYGLALEITKNRVVACGALGFLATATSPIYYSTYARGYSLLMIFALLSIKELLPLFQSSSNRLISEPKKISWKAVLVLGSLWALGTWTVPTFVFFEGALFAILIILIFFSRHAERTPFLRTLAALTVALILFYIQYFIIIAPEMLCAAKTNAAAIATADFFPELISEWTQPWNSFGWLFVLLSLLGIRANAIRDSYLTINLSGVFFLPIIMAWSAPFLGLMDQIPHPRVFLFLLPLFYIWVAQGAWNVFEWIQRAWEKQERGLIYSMQKTSYSALFLVLIAWGIQDRLTRMWPQNQHSEDYQKVEEFINELGPRDLILTSNKQHVWFYLYGANPMRKRVDRILKEGQLDSIYFLANFQKGPKQDAEWIKGAYGKLLRLKGYSNITSQAESDQEILIPEVLLEHNSRIGSFHFLRVKSKMVRPLARLHSPLALKRRGIINAPERPLNMVRNEPRKTSSFQFRSSFFIFDKQPLPPENAVFSIDLFLVRAQIPPSAEVLFSNGKMEGSAVRFNPTWRGNDFVMDHPYGPDIYHRPWVSSISLSHPTDSQPILMVRMGTENQKGQISGMVAYRLQGLSSKERGGKP